MFWVCLDLAISYLLTAHYSVYLSPLFTFCLLEYLFGVYGSLLLFTPAYLQAYPPLVGDSTNVEAGRNFS